MKKESGFTVIEAIVAAIVLVIIGVFFVIQRNELQTSARDQSRKTAINSMYYGLTEVYHPANKYYPTSINTDNLPSVDPELFKDSNGIPVGELDSEYTYEGLNCDLEGHCQSFRLSTILDKEAKYTRQP